MQIEFTNLGIVLQLLVFVCAFAEIALAAHRCYRTGPQKLQHLVVTSVGQPISYYRGGPRAPRTKSDGRAVHIYIPDELYSYEKLQIDDF